jgi:hypothetical protein
MLHLAEKLKLPTEVVTQAVGILAKRRAGKSYCARRFTEQLFTNKQQVVIADPKGDWWGIRSAANGKSPGLNVVILGGERGDVPLEAGSGEVVAKLVVEERVSVLLDLSLLRKHEVATFMTAFLENLYRLKAREIYRTPLMLIIDEADAIAPQSPMKGEERMLGATEDIVRRGGQRGIGCTMITQRSAVLNKNVLTQIQMLICLRTIAPQDLKAINAWIDVHGSDEERRMLMDSLPSLPIGDAWFWSPGWPSTEGIFQRAHVLPIETFDSGATPKPGEKRREPKNLADVDLDALKRQMAETIERAKADDPKALRKKIADLESQVAKSAKAVQATVEKPGKTKEVPVVPPKLLDQAVKAADKAEQLVDRAFKIVEPLRKLHEELIGVRAEIRSASLKLASQPSPATSFRGHKKPTEYELITGAPNAGALPDFKTVTRLPPREASNGDGTLTRMQRTFLTVLAQEREPVEKGRLLALAGYRSSGDVSKCFAQLVADGWADSPRSGSLSITHTGLEVLGSYEPLPRGAELRSLRLSDSILEPFERKALAALFEAYPESLAKGRILELTGYKSSGDVSKSFARLVRIGWATKFGHGSLRAADLFFKE